jgi:DNA-binding response OmpR family regulator
MRILIIEDDAAFVASLYAYLEPRGYVLDCAVNGYGGFALMAQNAYDAILIDSKLPGMNGPELCRKLRDELKNDTPVVMMSVWDQVEDRVAGFESGADDYLVKPFSLLELDARLKALVRRAHGRNRGSDLLTVGDLNFNTATYQVKRGGAPVALTKTGFKILYCLMREAPKVVSRETLESEVWGENPPDSDALRTHIHALRQAMDKPYGFPMLKTVQGIGYRLVSRDPDKAPLLKQA